MSPGKIGTPLLIVSAFPQITISHLGTSLSYFPSAWHTSWLLPYNKANVVIIPYFAGYFNKDCKVLSYLFIGVLVKIKKAKASRSCK